MKRENVEQITKKYADNREISYFVQFSEISVICTAQKFAQNKIVFKIKQNVDWLNNVLSRVKHYLLKNSSKKKKNVVAHITFCFSRIASKVLSKSLKSSSSTKKITYATIKIKQMKNKKKKKEKKKKEKFQNQNNVRDELKKRHTCKNKTCDHEKLCYIEKTRSSIKHFHIVDRHLS